MPYAKRKRSSSYPGSSKRRRTVRRGARRTYRRTRRRSSKYNAAVTTKLVTTPGRGLNLRTLGLPQTLVVHLPYREYVNDVTGTAGIPTRFQWNLNSMFDPYSTGSGNQPRYYDQLCTLELYRRYRVYKADVTVTIRNRSTNDVQAFCQIRNTPTDVPVTQAEVFYQAEFPYSASRVLNGTADGGDKARTTFKFSVNMAKFFGGSKTTFYGSDLFEGTNSSNPGELCVMTCGVSDDPAEGTAALPFDMEVSIVYHAVLSKLAQTVTQS